MCAITTEEGDSEQPQREARWSASRYWFKRSRERRDQRFSLMERLETDMHEACLKIDKQVRVLTVHGSGDKVVPAADAEEFAKIIPNHKLEIVKKADHGYTKHQSLLVSTVMEFIK
ncbi:unnamed protein product [Brassica rapa]|uniref:Serine aminopeptidase S33 domain-containing protein n=1 Tax=Brassica campestris TaxID=3711 RepID=A0A3P5YFZ5_BRACM|nr:unnamed protein product [Brassica rapa]VDC66597.1 unnamed protein product [Brassica rapa]